MHTNESTPPILIAFELSNKTWQTASTDGKRTRYKSLPAHDMEALMAEIKHLPGHFRLESPSFISCYEAGRDGFSVQRMLDKLNVANLVVDSASIEVPRGHKQVKTDMVDAKKLLKLLQRHVGGNPTSSRSPGCPSRRLKMPGACLARLSGSRRNAQPMWRGSSRC
jgi:transposase